MAKYLTISTLDGKEEYKYRVRKDNGKLPCVGQCVETEKSYYIVFFAHTKSIDKKTMKVMSNIKDPLKMVYQKNLRATVTC